MVSKLPEKNQRKKTKGNTQAKKIGACAMAASLKPAR